VSQRYEDLAVEVCGRIGWIRINRPDLRNALDAATMKDLARNLRAAEHGAARCVVLTGAVGNFCGGGDVSVVRTPEDYHDYTANLAEVCDAIAALTKPFIARVRGRATAAGMALVALADVAIATRDAVFGTPEISHGMFPMMAMGPIAREVGRKAAWRLFYSGELVGGDDALSLGILTEVVEDEATLDRRVESWVARVAAADPRPLALGRQLYYELLDAPPSQAVRLGGKFVLRLLALRQSAPPRADYLVSK